MSAVRVWKTACSGIATTAITAFAIAAPVTAAVAAVALVVFAFVFAVADPHRVRVGLVTTATAAVMAAVFATATVVLGEWASVAAIIAAVLVVPAAVSFVMLSADDVSGAAGTVAAGTVAAGADAAGAVAGGLWADARKFAAETLIDHAIDVAAWTNAAAASAAWRAGAWVASFPAGPGSGKSLHPVRKQLPAEFVIAQPGPAGRVVAWALSADPAPSIAEFATAALAGGVSPDRFMFETEIGGELVRAVAKINPSGSPRGSIRVRASRLAESPPAVGEAVSRVGMRGLEPGWLVVLASRALATAQPVARNIPSAEPTSAASDDSDACDASDADEIATATATEVETAVKDVNDNIVNYVVAEPAAEPAAIEMTDELAAIEMTDEPANEPADEPAAIEPADGQAHLNYLKWVAINARKISDLIAAHKSPQGRKRRSRHSSGSDTGGSDAGGSDTSGSDTGAAQPVIDGVDE